MANVRPLRLSVARYREYSQVALTTRCTERGFARSVRARFNLFVRFAFIRLCQPRQ